MQTLYIISMPRKKFSMPQMGYSSICLLVFFIFSAIAAAAQGTAPTFQYTAGSSLTLAGHDPAQGGATTIPTILVPITLSFETKEVAGKPFRMDAGADVPRVLASPIFSRFRFAQGGMTQYADAMMRATFPGVAGWHTLLGKPKVRPAKITVPAGYGYVLTSKKTGKSLAIVDVEFLQRELFKQIPRQDGSLIIAVTHNTAFYAYGDATVCCSWGTHGVDSATGNSFLIGSYLHAAPAIVKDRDVQPLTEQLAEFFNDPLHNPLLHGGPGSVQPNAVPAWMHPVSMNDGVKAGCGGTGIASSYVLMEPTDRNPRSEIPVSEPFLATAGGVAWHLENVALLRWYTGAPEAAGGVYSFPDARVLTAPATPCPARDRGRENRANMPPPPAPTVAAIPLSGSPNGHRLIGYWAGYGPPNSGFRLRDVSPQWDIVIVAFATPDKLAPEGTLQFRLRGGTDADQFRGDIALLKSQGKKVMISLGGGGKYFTLDDAKSIPNFVSSVSQIITEYGFDGIDLDFETPSLSLDPGDTDFKNPKTPSVVNLISGLRQLHDRFGPGFMISLVPEGTQIPGGYATYGGQFGSYIPIAWAVRDILSFVDVQDYNTPPLEGLDGEIYQLSSVDYHAAMTELLLHGFRVGKDAKQFFPPIPADKVATGFLVGDTTPAIVSGAMDYIITGKAPAGTTYKLRKPSGYPGMIGAMFWTIDADCLENYSFSNQIGPQLHGYPEVK
jgi:chitinase